MPFCPKCKYEYVEGIETCPDCYVDLVPVLEADQSIQEKYTNDLIVFVFDSEDRMESIIVKGILDSAGIPAQLGAGYTGKTSAFAKDNLFTDNKLYVLECHAEEAQRIIESYLNRDQ